MFSDFKLQVWRLYRRIKERNIEKLVIEKIERYPIEGQDEQIIKVVGWYHYRKLKNAPSLSIIIDTEVVKTISTNKIRPDIKKNYGTTLYPNGFSISFLVKNSANQLKVSSLLTGTELYAQLLNKIPFDSRTPSIKKEEDGWIKKIPYTIRLALAKKTQNDGYLVGLYTTDDDQMVYDLIQYLNSPTKPLKGYNIISYLSSSFGVAEAGRAYVDYHVEKNSPIVIFDYLASWYNSKSKEGDEKYTSMYFQPFIYDTNVFLINIHATLRVKEAVPEFFKNRRLVTSYWWEFETGFENDIPALNQFDEILVFSDFILNILKKIKHRKFIITKIQYPFVKNWTILQDPKSIRQRYSIGDQFCFFFNFDFSSSYGRKNPQASLKAFYLGFEQIQNVLFIYKTKRSDRYNNKYDEFLSSIQKYGLEHKVLIVNDDLTRDEFMSLLNATNCYVSLHRGEGLGLGILEALSLNIPVVATNYGGNVEYMNHKLAYPVDYELVPRIDDFTVYNDVKEWAEPNVEHASSLMRQVYDEISK